MFHGESEVFIEIVEKGEIGFCMVFTSEGSLSIVYNMAMGGGGVGREG